MHYLLLGFFLIYAAPMPALQTPEQQNFNSSPVAKKSHEACKLITSSEIASVVGEAVKETRSSTQPGGGLLMSQCFFGMAASAKSVSLTLAAANPAVNPKLTAREFWGKQFHAPAQKDAKDKTEDKFSGHSHSEGEEDIGKPRAIAGLGEEAYWVGNAISGALYVLQGNTFLRVSVGGFRREPERIEKSKMLARTALKRL